MKKAPKKTDSQKLIGRTNDIYFTQRKNSTWIDLYYKKASSKMINVKEFIIKQTKLILLKLNM
jgi:hypothetical protein